ncbi:MAG TPA: hypothetical protein VHS31_10815 [Tepidisphaeraceae bacterium]|jgi:non-canonical (house-cleaning) NTP pyrophosphatase|nr:hypothetical protein [Tepidisphaeraceae bacterium]
MSLEHPETITVTEEPTVQGAVDRALTGLLGAYSSLGFEKGYARATRYLLAMFPVLIDEFDRAHVGVSERDRELLKVFAKFVEEKLTPNEGQAVLTLDQSDDVSAG